MSDIFDRYYKRYDAWYDRHRQAYLSELRVLRKALPRSGRGLEIGVGTGRFAAVLGIRYGVDTAGKMLGLARKRGVIARKAAAERLPYKDASFDYAAIIIALSFVKDPSKVLREASRVIRKGGKIVVAIVDKKSFLARSYRRRKGPYYRAAHFLGVKEVVSLLKAAGFGRFSYYQAIFKLPEKIVAVETPRNGYGRGGFAVISARKT